MDTSSVHDCAPRTSDLDGECARWQLYLFGVGCVHARGLRVLSLVGLGLRRLSSLVSHSRRPFVRRLDMYKLVPLARPFV
jgi:hypothetical protein